MVFVCVYNCIVFLTCAYITLKDVPQPQPAVALGLSILNSAPIRFSSKDMVAPSRNPIDISSLNTTSPKSRSFSFLSSVRSSLYWKPEHPPPSTRTRKCRAGLPCDSRSSFTRFTVLWSMFNVMGLLYAVIRISSMGLNYIPNYRFLLLCVFSLSGIHTIYFFLCNYYWYFGDRWELPNDDLDCVYSTLIGLFFVYMSLGNSFKKCSLDKLLFAWTLSPFSLALSMVRRFGRVRGILYLFGLFLIVSMPYFCDLLFYLLFEE